MMDSESGATPELEPKPWKIQCTIPLGGRIVELTVPFYKVSPEFPDAPSGPTPVIVEPQFPRTLLKLQEAVYHHERMLKVLSNELSYGSSSVRS